ncbi:ribonuclease regulator, partial [Vibrio campbellii]
SSLAAEVSSRVKITENLDLHATLDYQDWQQGFEVGLGFRF